MSAKSNENEFAAPRLGGCILPVIAAIAVVALVAALYSLVWSASPSEDRETGRGSASSPGLALDRGKTLVGTPVSVEEVRKSLSSEEVGDEIIGLKVSKPGAALGRLGFQDGDVMTYVGDEGLNRGQSADEIRNLLRPGAHVFVIRGGREESWLVPSV